MPEQFSVLLVEDDQDARRNMEDILSLDGYRIRSESHCLPAINAIESEHFDTVIVDWRLPDGDGAVLISTIERALPNTPVVVVTGMREFETAVTALRHGAYDFLTKPINADVLRSVLSRLVERKKHLNEIETAQKKVLANERLAAIGQMVAGLAHESRNAFQRSHACLAELSLDVQDMPESLRLVHKVQKALDDINLLLEEVRVYSAPIILERRPCELESMVRQTWQNIMDANAIKKPMELTIKRSEDFPQQCFFDFNRMEQVVRNLLENAIYACSDLSQIQVDLCLQDSWQPTIQIVVSDDGPGVAEDQREKIFAPFFTTKTKGTGLGLAICRRIVEAHDGQLFVADSKLGGARFVIEFPYRQK